MHFVISFISSDSTCAQLGVALNQILQLSVTSSWQKLAARLVPRSVKCSCRRSQQLPARSSAGRRTFLLVMCDEQDALLGSGEGRRAHVQLLRLKPSMHPLARTVRTHRTGTCHAQDQRTGHRRSPSLCRSEQIGSAQLPGGLRHRQHLRCVDAPSHGWQVPR